MPSVSEKQARFMRAVAHNPDFAKKVNVPQKVGRDFAAADQQVQLAQKLRQRKTNG